MSTAFKLTERKCNLFYVPQTYSLAHAVSADLNTVKGTLAWQFAIMFGQSDELRKQYISPGNMAALEDHGHFIYFLVGKENLYECCTYETLESALICMREHMRNHNVTKVAMPRIGCGNDQLHWPRVREIIQAIFGNEFNVEILICEHDAPQMSIPPKCQITEVRGNLFTAPKDYSLVHSVSADFAMCSGIALQFKCKFGQRDALLLQHKHAGNVAVLEDNERFVYNLVTKERNHERCTYPALYYALVAMREHMLEHKITKLAIPRLGCGIDRLNWLRVKQLFEFVFSNDCVDIVAYFYEPQTPRSMLKLSDCAICPTCKGSKQLL